MNRTTQISVVRRAGHRTVLALLAVTAGLLVAAGPAAASLKLDPTFGDAGSRVIDHDYAEGDVIAMDASARGVTFEAWDLWRLNPNGDPNEGFGEKDAWRKLELNGFSNQTQDMATLADGATVTAGYFMSFNSRGYDTGQMGPYIVKYTPDGALDQSFGDGGRITPGPRLDGYKGAAFGAVELDHRNRIVAGGKQGRNGALRIDRYLADGTPDRSFGKNGRVYFKNPTPRYGASVMDLKILPSGKILLTGAFKGRFFVLRLKANGKVDRSFGKRGWVGGPRFGDRYDCGEGLCPGQQLEVSPNGSITVSGISFPKTSNDQSSIIVRLRANGRPIKSFGRNGIVHLTLKLFKKLVPGSRQGPWPIGGGDGGLAPLPNGRTFVVATIPARRAGADTAWRWDAIVGLIVDRRGHIRKFEPAGRSFNWASYTGSGLGIFVDKLGPRTVFMSGWSDSGHPDSPGRPTIYKFVDK